ncbi:MAG: type III secretion system stator protein SctL [Kiritimatiellae bacterium]|nr:type III secretion system stator protein SctL [Kiritimatiellia bacterium]
MLLLNEPSLTIRASGRLVKAAERQWLRDADAVMKAAQTAAEQIRAEAKAVRQQASEAGYAQGLADAAQEIATLQVHWQREQALFRKSVLTSLTHIVATAVRQYMGLQPDEAVLAAQIRQAWTVVGQDQQRLSLRVSPDQYVPCCDQVHHWLTDYPALEHIDIREDATLPPKTCAIGSPAGWVTLSSDAQMAALERALQTLFQDFPV